MAISTIGIGKDYTTLSAWEAAEQRDLVTAADGEIAECYGGTNLAHVILAGWTTNETYYITIRAAEGEQHNGAWSTAKAHLIGAGFDGIYSQQTGTHVQGMQIQITGDDNNLHGITTSTNGALSLYVDDCLIRGNPNMVNFGREHTGIFLGVDRSQPAVIRNCVMYDFRVDTVNYPGNTDGYGILMINGVGLQAHVYNCTFYNCDVGVKDGYSDMSVRNCLSDCVASDYVGAFNAASDYNVATDTTAPGTNAIQSAAPSYNDEVGRHLALSSNQFTAEDLSPETYGMSDDILGRTRSTWNAGAFEYVAPVRHSVEVIFSGSTGPNNLINSGDAGYVPFNAPAGSNRAGLIFIFMGNPAGGPTAPATITMGGQTINRTASAANDASEGANDCEVSVYYVNEAQISAFTSSAWEAAVRDGTARVVAVWLTDVDQTAGVITTVLVGGTSFAKDIALTGIQVGDLCYAGGVVAYENIDRLNVEDTLLDSGGNGGGSWQEVVERVADYTSEIVTITTTYRAPQTAALGIVLRPASDQVATVYPIFQFTNIYKITGIRSIQL